MIFLLLKSAKSVIYLNLRRFDFLKSYTYYLLLINDFMT